MALRLVATHTHSVDCQQHTADAHTVPCTTSSHTRFACHLAWLHTDLELCRWIVLFQHVHYCWQAGICHRRSLTMLPAELVNA